jgi:hypothetical protein
MTKVKKHPARAPLATIPIDQLAVKKQRLRNKRDRAARQSKVLHMRMVLKKTNAFIAKKLRVSERTIEHDLVEIRKRTRSDALENLSNEIRDIAEEMKLRHEESIRELWVKYEIVQQKAEEVARDLSRNNKSPAGDDAKERLEIVIELQKSLAHFTTGGLKILEQITYTDNSFVEQLRKLGLVQGEMDVDPEDGSLLLQIRARKAKIEEIRKKSGEPPAPAGGKG